MCLNPNSAYRRRSAKRLKQTQPQNGNSIGKSALTIETDTGVRTAVDLNCAITIGNGINARNVEALRFASITGASRLAKNVVRGQRNVRTTASKLIAKTVEVPRYVAIRGERTSVKNAVLAERNARTTVKSRLASNAGGQDYARIVDEKIDARTVEDLDSVHTTGGSPLARTAPHLAAF
jgi:hypothetical protein